ncbi:MAG: hypothetical protein ABIH21_05805 [Patescibacteria group bacterium]
MAKISFTLVVLCILALIGAFIYGVKPQHENLLISWGAYTLLGTLILVASLVSRRAQEDKK